MDGDKAIHNWYRFVLAFPPHLVRGFLDRCGVIDGYVLDPFCGTGTTLLESKLRSIAAIGIDANPVACLAARVKTSWLLSASELKRDLHRTLSGISHDAACFVRDAGIQETLFDLSQITPCAGNQNNGVYSLMLTEDAARLLPKGYISEKPLAKVIRLRDAINRINDLSRREFFLLALAATIVRDASNVGFGPEIYLSKVKRDAPVFEAFGIRARRMIRELELAQAMNVSADTVVLEADARNLSGIWDSQMKGKVIGAVLTSPPYPNEKDYTRTTRLELVLLGYLKSREELRFLKGSLVRSSTRNVFQADREGEEVVRRFRRIKNIADAIERRRIQLNKTSGFERLYHKVVAEYFGGMYRHLRQLFRVVERGALCGYVVGDQMSYLMVPIQTGQILAEMVEDVGFREVEISTWRERWATASRKFLKEEIVYFRK